MDDVRIDWQRIERPFSIEREAEVRDLIGKIAGKDKAALKDLYHRFGGKILAMLNMMLDDRTTSSDVLADVFVRIWRDAGDFDLRRQSPTAWLFARLRACVLARGPINRAFVDHPLAGKVTLPDYIGV